MIADGEEPAWAPDGKLAFVRDGKILVRGKVVATGRQPTWGPTSDRLAYVREGTIYVGSAPVAKGTQPDWQPDVRTSELLPDFDQRPPADLMLSKTRGRWLLGFTSYVDNIGLGPAVIVGRRPPASPRMLADSARRALERRVAQLPRRRSASLHAAPRRTGTGT